MSRRHQYPRDATPPYELWPLGQRDAVRDSRRIPVAPNQAPGESGVKERPQVELRGPTRPSPYGVRFGGFQTQVGVTPGRVLPYNENRTVLLIQLISGNPVSLGFDGAAAFGLGLVLSTVYSSVYLSEPAPLNEIWAVSNGGGATVYILQG